MIAGEKKSIHNPCPICGLPRGKGPHEFSHGKCAEERAKTEGKKLVFNNSVTLEQHEKHQRSVAADRYKAGKLPPWMFD
jgi:hypothetical protein